MRRIVLTALITLILLPCIALAFANTPPGRSVSSSLASRWLHREVHFGGYLYPVVWPPGIHVSKLTVANMEDGKAPLMADIGSLTITLGPHALAHGKLRIHELSLLESALHLERDSEGHANWEFSSTSSHGENSPPSLGTINLENSVLTYVDPKQKTDLKIEASSRSGQLVYNGSGTHLGKQFSVNGNVASSCLRHHAADCPIEMAMTVGHTSLHANGTLASLVPPEKAEFRFDIKGASASELFPLFGIALPMTPPYHLTGHLTYEDQRWHFSDFSGSMGESDLSGDVVWDQSADRPKLQATLTSKQLRFVDLGPLIGVAPKTQLSEEQKNLAAQQQASPYLIPDIPLDISRVSAMDADVEFTGKQVISEQLPLDNFYMKLLLDDRLMKFKPLRFGTASGDIVADMTIDARKSPVTNQANIRFDHLALARLLGNAGESLGNIERATGDIGGTLTLSGPGQSLHEMLGQADGVAGFGMEGGSISNLLVKLLSLDIARSLGFMLTGDKPLAIRCFVASFDVDKGLMKTDSFVFDTADTNISGRGNVDLKKEQIGLRLEPAPKDATLLSLRSPIDIRGTFKHPDVSIEKGPLAARGGIATGLAVLAPVAAVVALADPGMGKDSDCPALMANMNAKTGKTPKTNEVPKNPEVPRNP